jgi:hypothetical protein
MTPEYRVLGCRNAPQQGLQNSEKQKRLNQLLKPQERKKDFKYIAMAV